MSISKTNSKSTVTQEVNFEEARKNLLEEELILCDYKPVLQMHSRLNAKDEDQLSPWYFTHV